MRSIIGIVLLAFGLASCNDFLEESSQDEVRPSSVNDMEELLVGEGYSELYVDYYTNTTEYFTDDIMCNGNNPDIGSSLIILQSKRWQFGWQPDMFDEKGGGNDRNFWEMPYQKIKGCNLVLDYMDKVSGDAKKREHIRGEAYALRGFYYFLLVNYFGMPYNEGDPANNPAVPLKLTMDVTNELFKRDMVEDVYRSIVDDLSKGAALMEENVISKHYDRLSHLAAKTLLSRVYLYMERWDEAAESASQVIAEKPGLLSLASLSNLDDVSRYCGVYVDDTPQEIIWARKVDNVSTAFAYGRHPYTVSPELDALYETSNDMDRRKDLRNFVYFAHGYDMNTDEDYKQFPCKDKYLNQSGIRTAEVYLNRAEAYARKFMETKSDEWRVKALADLNYLRKHRYDTRNEAYADVMIQDAEELFQFCKDERRRELCGEGNHRWFDLRRWGMPRLEHVYFVNPGEEQMYTLEAKSPAYVLPIPSRALEYNPGL